MKTFSGWFLASLLLAGCATSTIETRKQERYSVYSELSPQDRAAVDAGQIKVGMSMDAVYIAWGKPSQVISGESSQGATVTWLYFGTYLEEYHYWSYRPFGGYCGRYFSGAPYLASDFYPRNYVTAEVVFAQGKVKEWRTLPRLGY